MLTRFMAQIVFWCLFGVGAVVTLYALFLVGYKGYLKIKELFTTSKAKKVEAKAAVKEAKEEPKADK